MKAHAVHFLLNKTPNRLLLILFICLMKITVGIFPAISKKKKEKNEFPVEANQIPEKIFDGQMEWIIG